jgi:predicted DNA-binding ribbon-helix-helix protein
MAIPLRVAGNALRRLPLSSAATFQRGAHMTAVTLELSEEKLRRLHAVARARGISVAQLLDEVSSALIADHDAQTRFRLRAQRGAGKEARGLELLDKAAGRAAGAEYPGQAG